jgi:hypothetical protein
MAVTKIAGRYKVLIQFNPWTGSAKMAPRKLSKVCFLSEDGAALFLLEKAKSTFGLATNGGLGG